jgi:acyl carrier protein
MNLDDRLLLLLIEFFDLPTGTRPDAIKQDLLPVWDSLAMVQLITELEKVFSVSFDIAEIDRLRSYDEIQTALSRRACSAGRQ